jgi:trimeric autotransporter adhesin
MRKALFVLATSAAMVVSTMVPVAADTGSLPGGTSLSAEIASPAADAIVPVGALTVSGTAAVGAAPALKNATVVYALDVSGSAANPAGVDCDGGGLDTILQCEKAAVATVNAAAAAPTSPVLNSGVVAFSNTATARDVDPAAGTQLLSAPGPNITNAVAPLTAGGGTSFVAAVTAANSVLTAPGATANRTLVFLSDGLDTSGGSPPALPAGTIVRAFAIGGSNCNAGTLTLASIAALGAVGSSCTTVTDMSVLDNVIGAQVGATFNSLTIAVDGGPATPISNSNIDPDLPQTGPASVTYSTSVTLASGPHTICVTANGTDVGGPGSVSDCVNVTVAATVIQCGTGSCSGTATDGNVSTAQFNGQNLSKTVGLSSAPTATSECGGANCVTGYDVSFPGTTGNGRASLLVKTARNVSTPFWKAEIYLDGAKVTRSCIWNVITKTEVLPCKIIGPTLTGGTFYYVKFAADPRFRFR